MADNAVRDENCAIEDIGQEGKTAVGDKRVSEVDEGKGQTADRSSEETNSTTATPASYSREGYLESSGNYSAAGGCFNPTVEALQVCTSRSRKDVIVTLSELLLKESFIPFYDHLLCRMRTSLGVLMKMLTIQWKQ